MADPTQQRPPQRAPQRPRQRRVIYTLGNIFDVIDISRKPDDMTYQWKVQTVAGEEATRQKVVAEMNGWTPVPANRHPELTGSAGGDGPIIMGGQMLMEQPKEWAAESRALDEFAARNTLEENVQRLGIAAKRGGGKGVKRQMDTVPELVE
jgi:hypothetical protein